MRTSPEEGNHLSGRFRPPVTLMPVEEECGVVGLAESLLSVILNSKGSRFETIIVLFMVRV